MTRLYSGGCAWAEVAMGVVLVGGLVVSSAAMVKAWLEIGLDDLACWAIDGAEAAFETRFEDGWWMTRVASARS